jgi:hypothetical protein
MLARWNTAFALAEGRIRNTRINLHRFIPPTLPTSGALVDTLGAALLHAPLPADARAALVEYASDRRGEGQPLDRSTLDRKLPELAALLLASPTFQMH